MFTNWLQGEIARLEIQIFDQDGIAIDAPDIVLKAISPSGVLQTVLAAQIQQEGTGSYYFNLPLSQPGHWYWRWETGGSAVEGHLSVQPSRFA